MPKICDLQIGALSIKAKSLGMETENLLFSKLKKEYLIEILIWWTGLISSNDIKMAYCKSLISQSIADTIEPDS